jgi:hypothetical protein
MASAAPPTPRRGLQGGDPGRIPGVSLCGEPDTRNAAAQPSVPHAAGRIIDDAGTARYGAHLRVGDTSGALFGPGLLGSRGAEVILVLPNHGVGRINGSRVALGRPTGRPGEGRFG